MNIPVVLIYINARRICANSLSLSLSLVSSPSIKDNVWLWSFSNSDDIFSTAKKLGFFKKLLPLFVIVATSFLGTSWKSVQIIRAPLSGQRCVSFESAKSQYHWISSWVASIKCAITPRKLILLSDQNSAVKQTLSTSLSLSIKSLIILGLSFWQMGDLEFIYHFFIYFDRFEKNTGLPLHLEDSLQEWKNSYGS